jgi:hypothetical protein
MNSSKIQIFLNTVLLLLQITEKSQVKVRPSHQHHPRPHH